MDWTNNTAFYNSNDVNGTITQGTSMIFTMPDPLIDWLPNSCLYEKYLPTWHLVRSYY